MKPDERKKQILECAKKLFAQKGYYETQIIDIVHALNIGKGTPYQYFVNKEELFLALIDSIYESWRAFCEGQQQTAVISGPTDYLTWKLNTMLSFFLEDPDSAKILLRMGPGINRSIEPFVSRIEERFIEEIHTDVKKGIKVGAIDKDCDIDLLSNVIFGIVNRIAYQYIIRNPSPPARPNFNKVILKTTELLGKIIFIPEFWEKLRM